MENGKSDYKIKSICFIIALMAVISIFYFYPHKKVKFNLENLPKFEIGDLVFRKGDVLDSVLISKKSGFKYSHIGIVVKDNPIMIVHATTNDIKDRKNQVITSTFNQFLDNALDFGVARMEFLNKNQKEILVNSIIKEVGSNFVLAPKNENNLYCTTLLEKEISKFIDFKPKYTYVNTPFFQGEYLFPKAFWFYEGVRIIYEN